MICQETQNVIHAYVDGELDLVKTLDVERHIRECRECTTMHENLIALRLSIRDGSLYYRAPVSLERRIRSDVARNLTATAATGRPAFPRNWIAAAAAIALVATGVWLAARGLGGGSERLLAAEVTSAHVRSLMAEHLWDVKSTGRHTVKPWFDGKLDFAPDVRDFKTESFALEGGRLDYLADRPVAALVYSHQKHYVNLFIWPAAGQPDRGEVVTHQRGYALVHWVHSGMNYWAVSDASEDTLRRFADLVHERDSAATATKPAE